MVINGNQGTFFARADGAAEDPRRTILEKRVGDSCLALMQRNMRSALNYHRTASNEKISMFADGVLNICFVTSVLGLSLTQHYLVW